MEINSTPFLCGFNPQIIKSQWDAINLVRRDYDYKQGPLELLLSGSVGSSKSLLMAHIGVTHCLKYKKAKLLVGRKSMPDLKKTILQAILDHISEDMREGKDYEYNKTSGVITFANGAMIIPISWGDGLYTKFRSYEFSAGIIEELTENDSDEFVGFHTELIGRIGRVKTPEPFLIYATNPDSPSHAAYSYFDLSNSNPKPNRKVIYSLTKDNPFLPKWYIENLEATYDSKMIKRLLYGQWLHIETDVIYYEYNPTVHYVLSNTHADPAYPLRFTFDFNIGQGKPMSALAMQYLSGVKQYRAIDEFILPGARTYNIMDEISSKGYLDLPHNPKIIIHGDSTGKSRDTRSIKSDYDIISDYLSNYIRKDKAPIRFEIVVPLANPPIRKRHNLVNGALHNSKNVVSLYIDKRCKVLDEGLTKTKLVDSGNYTEDDSNSYQHVTTALGYAICAVEKEMEITPSRTISF